MAFYGRAGNALMKSLKRLSIDPLAVYGTLCVKCPVPRSGDGRPRAAWPGWSRRSRSSRPRSSVVMGPDALAVVNELDLPLRRDLRAAAGRAATAHPEHRGPVRPEHRRLARRGGRQARVLGRVPGARPVVGGPAAVLVGSVGELAVMSRIGDEVAPPADRRSTSAWWRSWVGSSGPAGAGQLSRREPTPELREAKRSREPRHRGDEAQSAVRLAPMDLEEKSLDQISATVARSAARS